MFKTITAAVAMSLLVLLGACTEGGGADNAKKAGGGRGAGLETAIFAGGCFWCMEPPFEKQPGVIEVISGYTGGRTKNPDYDNYAAGGHIEAVEILFDPKVISYDRLLDVFWMQINPTDPGGQFVDRGPQYRSAIFYLNDGQKEVAERSRGRLAKSGRFREPIVTGIIRAGAFYPAEEYHQDYYRKSAPSYKFYRYRSGRDEFLDMAWGKDRAGH